MFNVIKKKCVNKFGYSGVLDVHEKKVQHDKVMPSHFLTQIMKPLYLLFAPVRYI